MLLSAYRRDDLADADGFVAQLGVVLEDYSEAVIIAVTGPRSGLQRRCKWLPTIAEVIEACEAEAISQATRARYAVMPPVKTTPRIIDDRSGHRANVFVPSDNPRYERACELAKTADPADWTYDPQGRSGIWIGLNLLEQPRPQIFKQVAEKIDEIIEPQAEAAECTAC